MTTTKRMSKAQVYAELADKTGLSKKDVQGVFTAMFELIERELGTEGPGEFIVPDMIKLRVKETPGRPEHEGVDPFTKQQRTFPARPPSRRVKSTPLKPLKALIE